MQRLASGCVSSGGRVKAVSLLGLVLLVLQHFVNAWARRMHPGLHQARLSRFPRNYVPVQTAHLVRLDRWLPFFLLLLLWMTIAGTTLFWQPLMALRIADRHFSSAIITSPQRPSPTFPFADTFMTWFPCAAEFAGFKARCLHFLFVAWWCAAARLTRPHF
ncbi:hypothetical protein BKA81DRAFT_352320 [Phyllosticta paracitricarpa]